MSTDSPQPCTHSRGPGTTVCLRCRAEERARSAARIKAQVARGAAIVALIAIAIVGAVGLTGRLRGDNAAGPTAAVASPVAELPAAGGVSTVVQAGDSPAPVSESPYRPLIDADGADLGDSVIAVRRGDTVIVQFDTEMSRTRRADKFDRLVRWTVPRIYGPSVARRLPSMPLARDGQLTAMLPETGIHVQLDDGWILHLWPLTREGRDGALITAYRAVISR